MVRQFGSGRRHPRCGGVAAAFEAGYADGDGRRMRVGGVEMRKLASFLMLTLDGYFEGESPWTIDWHNVDDEFNDFAIKQLDESDRLVFGRATYLGMAQYWPSAEALKNDPEVAARMNSAPKIVVSRTLEEPEPPWANTRLIRGRHGTDFVLTGLSDVDMAAAKDYFLRFAGDEELEGTDLGAILKRQPGEPVRIYVKGLRVALEEEFLFSYNIISTTAQLQRALNRERTNVGRSAYQDRVKAILVKSKSVAVAEQLVQDLTRIPAGTNHDET